MNTTELINNSNSSAYSLGALDLAESLTKTFDISDNQVFTREDIFAIIEEHKDLTVNINMINNKG